MSDKKRPIRFISADDNVAGMRVNMSGSKYKQKNSGSSEDDGVFPNPGAFLAVSMKPNNWTFADVFFTRKAHLTRPAEGSTVQEFEDAYEQLGVELHLLSRQ